MRLKKSCLMEAEQVVEGRVFILHEKGDHPLLYVLDRPISIVEFAIQGYQIMEASMNEVIALRAGGYPVILENYAHSLN